MNPEPSTVTVGFLGSDVLPLTQLRDGAGRECARIQRKRNNEMRRIGTLPTAESTTRFGRYLTANGIENRLDQQNGDWEIWVYDEDQVNQAKTQLHEFSSNPHDTKYDVLELPDKAPPPPPPRPRPAPRRSPRANTSPSGRMPVTVALVAVSIFVSLRTDFGANQRELISLLQISRSESLREIAQGEIWRLFTPMFLHFHFLHLAFNMYMTWMLGGVIERIKGSRKFSLIVLATSVAANLAQFLFVHQNFGGMSGVVYGLFGYLWMKSVFSPREGFMMPGIVVAQLIIWLVLGFGGYLGNMIANYAHLGGLLAGMAIGAAPAMWARD